MIKKSQVLLVFLLGNYAVLSQVDLIQNVYNRSTTSLNGSWNYIIDPYENGYYNYRYEPFDQQEKPSVNASKPEGTAI